MVAIADQVEEQVEDLRLDMDRSTAAAELASFRVEDTIAEEKTHPPAPDPGQPTRAMPPGPENGGDLAEKSSLSQGHRGPAGAGSGGAFQPAIDGDVDPN